MMAVSEVSGEKLNEGSDSGVSKSGMADEPAAGSAADEPPLLA
jgi:hypothetical protein